MKAMIGFSVAYTVSLLAYGLAVDSPLTLTYTGLTVLIFANFGVMHRWARFPLDLWWGISFVGLVNMIGGVVLMGGDPIYIAGQIGPLPFDKVFHAAAAAVFYPVAWHAMRAWAGDGFHRGGLMVLTFLVVMGGGAVVEIAELIGTAVGEVSVGDYGNNALDLVANAAGALVGWVYVLWQERGAGRPPTPARSVKLIR